MKLWSGRFGKETDALVNDFNASIQFDQRLYKEDITGSIAHARMLGKIGVLTEEEILDMARDIAENDPAYIIGSMLIKSVCDDTGLDEGAAFSMLLDGGGMPKGIAAISARAANDLMRLYKEGGIEGEIDSYLEDERFVRMLLEMPVKAALRLYAAECNADAAAKAEREKGAMDVMEKLAARRALPSPIKGNTPAAADTDYANMPTREFNLIKERLMRAASEGRRVSL